MEELQLALTSTRVEQRNFGLWLKSWQVGQVLQALVTDKAPSGQLLLTIGGHRLTASTDIPVQKGAVLTLEVNSLTPTPVLKVLSAAIAEGQRSNALAGQLQVLLPRQGKLTDVFSLLLDPASSARLQSVPGISSGLLQQLLRHLNSSAQLTNAAGLRAAMQRSGLFLEPNLLRSGASGQPTFPADIKADLLKLLEQMQGREMRVSNASTSLAEQLGGQLRDKLEAALATLTLNQLATRTDESPDSRNWVVQLPLLHREAVECLYLNISRQRKHGAGSEDDEWKVLFEISLEPLGKIEAEIYLRADKLSLVIYAEQRATARAIDDQMPRLRAALESKGLTTAVLLSHQGAATRAAAAATFQTNLDERV